MFRNQLNCCKYKSLSSSCTKHRAECCEHGRTCDATMNSALFGKLIQSPAASENETPYSIAPHKKLTVKMEMSDTEIDRERERTNERANEKHRTEHTNTNDSWSSRSVVDLKWMKNSGATCSLCFSLSLSDVCVPMCIAFESAFGCSLRVFRLQWVLTLNVHMTSVWLQPATTTTTMKERNEEKKKKKLLSWVLNLIQLENKTDWMVCDSLAHWPHLPDLRSER